MHLSKLFISWSDVRNPYDIHKALWQLFPHRPDGNRNFLFRIEKICKGQGADILMQSENSPISGQCGIRIVAERNYDILLKIGQRLRFRIRANPTKKINDERGRRNPKGAIKKCRVPLINEEEQRRWLEHKLGNACCLETLIMHREVPLYFRKPKEKRTGKIQTVLYDGLLKVENPDVIHDQLRKGIGPAKAFGCGLLSVASVSL